MTYLRCASCGSPLTRECRWGTPEEHDFGARDRAPAVAPGVTVRLPQEEAVATAQKDDVVGMRVYSPAGAISINPSDMLPDSLRSAGRDAGCCGSDGCDGPNRACACCGAMVATEWSDCWTQAEVRFLPEAVEAA